MTAARALRIDDWVVHRPNVVRSVAARVPGIDAEEAASRALEKMVRIVSTGGTIDDPAPYWRRAAVNEAISMTREAGRAHPVEDDTLDGLTPPVAGAELDAERHADVTMLRTALSDLADDDRQILLRAPRPRPRRRRHRHRPRRPPPRRHHAATPRRRTPRRRLRRRPRPRRQRTRVPDHPRRHARLPQGTPPAPPPTAPRGPHGRLRRVHPGVRRRPRGLLDAPRPRTAPHRRRRSPPERWALRSAGRPGRRSAGGRRGGCAGAAGAGARARSARRRLRSRRVCWPRSPSAVVPRRWSRTRPIRRRRVRAGSGAGDGAAGGG